MSDTKGAGPLERRPTYDDNLVTRVDRWATPRATDGEKGGPNQTFTDGGGMPLMAQIARWPMPRTVFGDYTRDNGRKGKERLTLEGKAKWSTPSVADVTGGRANRSGARKNERLLNGQAPDLCSHLDPTTSTPGHGSRVSHLNAYLRCRATTDLELRSEMRSLLRMAIRRRDRVAIGAARSVATTSSKPARRKVAIETIRKARRQALAEARRFRRGWTKTAPTAFVRPSFRRSLNPRFVADLMGWPPGLTSFACSETAWSNWRERMRSELLGMTLHVAPPAQLALFG